MTLILASFCTSKLVKFLVTEYPPPKTFLLSEKLKKIEWIGLSTH